MMHPHSPGAVFWTERGTIIYNALLAFIRERQRGDFKEVMTPLLYNKALWEISGHWGKYRENMFLVLDNETKEHDFSLTPMNCPSHYLLYQSKKHSYRELPLRYVTFDVLHRNEVTGALSGLTRVRQFQQDDCHVFLRQDQIEGEVAFLVRFILDYYRAFGLTATLKFATRPEVRIGTDAMWDGAESALRAALDATGLPYEIKPGDGAFYGPKIDFMVTASEDRQWQMATIQLDFQLPQQFGLEYRGIDNNLHTPIVIHRALYGSFERFIAMLLEVGNGYLPPWLSPTQVAILSVNDSNIPYCQNVNRSLVEVASCRTRLMTEHCTFNAKVREAEELRIPFIVTCGKVEEEKNSVTVRRAGRKELEFMSFGKFLHDVGKLKHVAF